MPRGTGFFRASASPDKNQGREYTYITVGGEPFHALAVAFIDNFKSGHRVDELVLRKILDRFFTFFPDYKTNQSYLSPIERTSLLLNTSRKSELVECMAYVFRQLTVEELYTHPLDYKEAFVGLNNNTLKAYLRQPTTVLPGESLSAAFAKALNVTVSLSFKEQGKELRMRHIYANDTLAASRFILDLQVQGTHYFPRVKHKADFTYVGQLAITAPVPVEPVSTGTMEDILDLIARDNDSLVQSFEQYRKALLSMVADGELNKDLLMAHYVRFMPNETSKETALFSRQAQVQEKQVIGEPEGGEQQVIDLLVDSLAGWVSTRQVQADELFDALEHPNPRRSSPAA